MGRVSSHAVSRWSRLPGCCGFCGGFRVGGFFRDFFFFRILFFLRTHTACSSMRPPCLIYLSTSTGVRAGCHYLISLPVRLCVSVCVTQGVFTSETDPRTSDLYSLLGACMRRTRYQVCCTWNERLETGVRTTSTRIVYSSGPLVRNSNLGLVLIPYRASQFQYTFL